MAMTTGSETTLPDFRPITSSVASQLGAMPDACRAAQMLLRKRAILFGRFSRYSQRITFCMFPAFFAKER